MTRRRADGKNSVHPAVNAFTVIDEMRAAFADVPGDELEREVEKAVAEVRAENAGQVPRAGTDRLLDPSEYPEWNSPEMVSAWVKACKISMLLWYTFQSFSFKTLQNLLKFD